MNELLYPCKIASDEYGELAVQFLDIEDAFTDGDDLEDAKKNPEASKRGQAQLRETKRGPRRAQERF